MSKLNTLVIAAALLFAAGAQAQSSDAATQASLEQTAQAMRTEGVDHLIPALRSDKPAAAARATVKTPAAKPAAAQAEVKPAAQPVEASPSRAAVIAELKRAREAGELEHNVAELGYVPAPIGRVSGEIRLAALQTRKAR